MGAGSDLEVANARLTLKILTLYCFS